MDSPSVLSKLADELLKQLFSKETCDFENTKKY